MLYGVKYIGGFEKLQDFQQEKVVVADEDELPRVATILQGHPAGTGKGISIGSGWHSKPEILRNLLSGRQGAANLERKSTYQRFAWLATFIGNPNKSMNPRAAVTSYPSMLKLASCGS